MPTRDIIASEEFDARIAARADRLTSVIDAFDEAMGKVLKRMVEWTIRAGADGFQRA